VLNGEAEDRSIALAWLLRPTAKDRAHPSGGSVMRRTLLWVSLAVAGLMGVPSMAGAQAGPAAVTPAPAAEPSAALRALSEWMMTYYQHPSPDRIPEVLAAIEPLTKDPGSAMFTLGFLSAVFEDQADKLAGWARSFDALPEAPRKIVLQAVWFSGTPEAQDVLFGIGSEKLVALFKIDMSSRRAFAADDRLLRFPSDLDYYWGRFFARGHDAPVRRIIAALPWQADKPITTPVTDDEKKLALRWAMGSAAQWGLTANARRHPQLLEICKAELAKANGPAHDYLEKAVRSADVHKTAERQL
jgi:hypothetical protein